MVQEKFLFEIMAKRNFPIDLEIGKIPPQALQLEESTLGAIMLERDAIDRVINILKPESFYRDENQKIYQAIIDLAKKDRAIDILTVTEQLRKNKTLDEVGGPLYVTQLTSNISSTSNIEQHALYVQEKFIKRELIRTSSELNDRAFDDSIDTQDLVDYANKLNDELNELIAGKQQIKRLDAVLDQSLNDALKRRKLRNEGRKIGIEPPLKSLKDKIFYWPNDLITVAARPSEGKTNFALHIARESANNGDPVCIYSLETDAIKLGDRYMLAESNVSDYDYRAGYIKDNDIKALEKAKKTLGDIPIYIDDNPIVSVDYIKTHSRLMKKKGRCNLIIIDYLQLTDTSGYKRFTRDQEISTITRTLKTHARNIGVPVIDLCQLNRDIEKRTGDKRPKLSDLRESGAIEMDSHIVMFIWTPSRYGIDEIDGKSTQGKTHLIIAKNKDGKVGEVVINQKYGLRYIWDESEFQPTFDKSIGKDAQMAQEKEDNPFEEEGDLPF